MAQSSNSIVADRAAAHSIVYTLRYWVGFDPEATCLRDRRKLSSTELGNRPHSSAYPSLCLRLVLRPQARRPRWRKEMVSCGETSLAQAMGPVPSRPKAPRASKAHRSNPTYSAPGMFG